MASGAGAGGGRSLGPESCAALLLLCWLCCWPDDGSSDTSSSRKHPRKTPNVESGSHRSGDFFSRRMGSSAISLHLPSTSGLKIPLSAHRSHEEIRSRRKSHHEPSEEARYHSAPSVIDEVIHRRDWERSSKDLYIPLNPQNECKSPKSEASSSPDPDRAPCAEPESSSIECLKPEEPKCKKHHKNIKSSKGKKCKESNKDDIKDTDATEVEGEGPNFYIGEAQGDPQAEVFDFAEYERLVEERNRSIYKAKEAKQSFNESVKLKELPRGSLAAVEEGRVVEANLYMDEVDGIDRSGAMHHTIESRMSFSRPYPPPSVETVGYDGGACYLAEVGSVSELRARGGTLEAAGPVAAPGGGTGWRARHASDGDILAPPHRPESGAFSESDLDIDLEALAREERPPPYHELQLQPRKRETAI